MTTAAWIDVEREEDVGEARRAVRHMLRDASAELSFRSEVVTSELVTNALLHGGGLASVKLIPLDGGVRIEVADRSLHSPLLALSSTDAMTGRGVSLVARFASRWGVEPAADGKVVWAEVVDVGDGLIETPPTESTPHRSPLLGGETASMPTVRVSLGNVPTPLLIAAKRHVDNLVREFTLAKSGGRTGTTAPVPAPLAELIEHVVNRFEDARREIKRQATDAARAGHSHTALQLDLRLDAADAAEEYLAALDEVDSYSRANRLLTLETPPKHRIFRHWYVGEIVKQLRAAAAGEPRPAVVGFEQRLLDEVDFAEAARRSADRAARLYSVAVALAGSETPEEVASAVLGDAVAALGATGGGVLLATAGEKLTVPGTIGYDDPIVAKLRDETRDAELPAAYALRTGEPVWLETIEERSERFPGLVGLEPDTIAMCAVPLAIGEEVLGALRFSFSDRRLFDEDEQRFVLALAAEAAEAVQRARLFAAEREARRRLEHERASLEKLAAVGEAMLRGGDLETVIRLATDAATQISAAEYGAFIETGDIDQASPFGDLALSRSLLGPTLVLGETVRIDEAAVGGDSGGVYSFLGVPVTLSDGEVVGGLFFGRRGAGRFGSDHERLVVGVAGQAAAAIENVRYVEDRARVAATLQQSLLPGALPSIPELDLGAVYLAAGAGVGGDFYDVFPLSGDTWGIAMGDVCGRGPAAASLTALTRYTIRTAALLGLTPAAVCGVLDEAMHTADDPERFCSALFARVAPSALSGVEVRYANAGHPPMAVVRAAGGVEFVPPTGGLIGIVVGSSFSEDTLTLRRGDALVLYTDGVSEARSNGEQFGDRRLAEVLATRQPDAQALAQSLIDEARRFAASSATDDAAVFVLIAR